MKAVNAKSNGTAKLSLVPTTLTLVPAEKAPAAVVAAATAPTKVDYEAMADVDLVIACQTKNQAAMTVLLKRYEKPIQQMIRRVGPDMQDQQDIVQEVYIRIWRSIDSLRNPYSFRKWVNQIITRLHYDALRKKVNSYQMVSMDEPMPGDEEGESSTRDIADSRMQPDAHLLNKELSEKLDAAMSGISEPFRTAVALRDIDGLAYEEIASLTNTELGTVKSRIARARMKMQKNLNNYLNDAA